ncbi:neurofilament heavy protein [Wolffia australiana]
MEGSKQVEATPENSMKRAKEEIKAIFHRERTHHRETHGTSDDIDENTPIDRVRGPGLIERAKEEIEALIETVHPKKNSNEEKEN